MLIALILSVVAHCCGSAQADQSKALDAAHLAATTTQAVVVSSDKPECISGAASLYAKTDNRWTLVAGPFPAVLGRKGVSLDKHEGDGKTPVGVYALGTTFGYAVSSQTSMPYRQTTSDDVWVDDAGAPDYNTWVKRADTHAKSFEQMHRDDGLYEIGVVVRNTTRIQ